MKTFFILSHLFLILPAYGVNWKYQVNINGAKGELFEIDDSRNSLDSGPYACEVTPVVLKDNTEYRTLTCAVGSSMVSTGGLCTTKAHKMASVQYAILNMHGPKSFVNVVVSCHF